MAVGGGVIEGCALGSVGWADNLVLKPLSDGVFFFSFPCFVRPIFLPFAFSLFLLYLGFVALGWEQRPSGCVMIDESRLLGV
jgi:hypothetical protein